MASPKPPGIEICVKKYEYVTVYFASKILKGEEAKQKEDEDKRLDDFCRFTASEHELFDPVIEQVVGVFLPSNNLKGQWVRGRVEQHLKRVNGSEYKVLLIDRGEYVMTKRQYMVQLPSKFCTNPPAAKKLGLYGVLPVCALDEKIKIVLTDFLNKGPAYFKKYGQLKDILFGDISVEQISDGQIVNLASHLLENGLVKKIENFETEAQKHYFLGPVVTEMEEKGACAKSCFDEDQDESSQSSITVCKDKRDETKRKEKDTGYSSEDDSDSPFYRPDAVLIPTGFNYVATERNKKPQKNDDKRPLKNYYHLIREQPKSRIKNEKSSPKSDENSKAKNDDDLENRYEETKTMKQEVNWNLKTSDQQNEEINHDYKHEFLKIKKVNSFERKSQEPKNISDVGNKKINTFDLNYKLEVDCCQKDVNKNEVKEFNSEVSKEIINSKESKSKYLEKTQGSVDSLDDSYLKKGFTNGVDSNKSKLSSNIFIYEDNSKSSLISKGLTKIRSVSSYGDSFMNKRADSVKSVSTCSSMVSEDSLSYTESLNCLSLSKKQRLIRKLTLAKEVREMIDSLTINAQTSHINPDLEDKSVKLMDSLTTDVQTSHINPDLEDKSVKISSNDFAESTYCADSNSCKNNSIFEKRRRSKEKWKRKSLTSDAQTSLVCADYSNLEVKSVKMIDSLNTDAQTSHISPDLEDKSVKISSNDCAESTYCVNSNSCKNNSIFEKRRRSKEKWKRKSLTNDAQTNLVCVDYSDLEVNSVKIIDSLTTDTLTNHISPDPEDKSVKISSNDCAESTYCVDSNSCKNNSIFEKRMRSKEKWKRKSLTNDAQTNLVCADYSDLEVNSVKIIDSLTTDAQTNHISPDLEDKSVKIIDCLTTDTQNNHISPDLEDKSVKIIDSLNTDAQTNHISPDLEDKSVKIIDSLTTDTQTNHISPDLEDKSVKIIDSLNTDAQTNHISPDLEDKSVKIIDSLTTDTQTNHISPDLEDKSVKIIDSLTTDTQANHISPDLEDKSVQINSNDCAKSTYCANSDSNKNNSIYEKRKRSQEKWKKKKEAELLTDSETRGRDLITSCSK